MGRAHRRIGRKVRELARVQVVIAPARITATTDAGDATSLAARMSSASAITAGR
jgi:hypothetical protein